MTLQVRRPRHELEPQSTSPQMDAGDADGVDPVDHQNVPVTYGIHAGRFPIRNQTISAARQVLSRLINIHPTAVPVIAGRPVTEDTVISDQVTLLSFVKPSALKGAAADGTGPSPTGEEVDHG